MTELLLSYFKFLGAGLTLIGLFMLMYERLTPYRELQLIREGNKSAALCFGGAVLGFTLTFVSSAMHSGSFLSFIAWAGLGGVMQLVVYGIACLGIGRIKEHITNDNVAVGLALFFLSVSVGGLNAAALS